MNLNPAYNVATIYCNRGFNKGKLGDYDEALQDYNKAIEMNPSFAYAYYNRGLAKYMLGNQNGPCSDCRKAQEMGENSAYELIINYCNQ
jgi:tetratricopeptide (TPR) repeat protein